MAVIVRSAEPDGRGDRIRTVSADIEAGQWQQASNAINDALRGEALSFAERQAILFQQERMRRIRQDFSQTRAATLAGARSILPDLTGDQFDRWEAAGAVEHLDIDGERWYFNRAAANLFRIHPEARALKEIQDGGDATSVRLRQVAIRQILEQAESSGMASVLPKRFRVEYTLSIKPGVVPEGEIIRAWLPYPHRGTRQTDVVLLHSQPNWPILSPPEHPLSSIYLEQPSRGSQVTRFTVSFEYTTSAYCLPVIPIDSPSSRRAAGAEFQPHLHERPPHLVFDAGLRRLSRDILGEETRPAVMVRALYRWISDNIPWAAAREYSTLDSLTRYALVNRRGDCGIQTLLFMSLCRLNGIPARWESGWITAPHPDLHDWCCVYLEPVGWIPVDVSFGLQPGDGQRERWFYLGGLDSGRLVLNTDYGQPLYPAKTFFRSEVVDFQRGEAEWRGGNLYFDQWTYDFRVEERPLGPLSVDRKRVDIHGNP